MFSSLNSYIVGSPPCLPEEGCPPTPLPPSLLSHQQFPLTPLGQRDPAQEMVMVGLEGKGDGGGGGGAGKWGAQAIKTFYIFYP